MSRKLASIVEIESCEPIPDTERLSVATMKGKGRKVAAELIADNADYAAVKARVFEQAGVVEG